MRMWMTDPKIMCNLHLLGEHRELHMFVSIVHRRTALDGYVLNNLLEPLSVEKRHEDLVQEMLNRGMKGHATPLQLDIKDLDYLSPEIREAKIDAVRSREDLLHRCSLCKSRAEKLKCVL